MALQVLDGDVLGLIEVQNDKGVATQRIVDTLNAATAPDTYASIDTGFIGTDAIKQAFFYKTATCWRGSGAWSPTATSSTALSGTRLRPGRHRPRRR